MMKNLRKQITAVGLAGIVVLALTACSQGGGETTATELSTKSIDTFVAAGGGKAGKAGAETIKIGWVNADSGPGATPLLTEQTDAAINLINTQLGGGAGATLVLDKCEITSEESGLACAQKFANDDSIVAVLQGNISSGAASFHSVMDKSGIPIVGPLPLATDDAGAPDAFYTTPGAFNTIPAVLELIADYLHSKSVAVIAIEGEPVSTSIGTAVADALNASGTEAKVASIDLAATDVTAPLVAAGVQNADLILALVIAPPHCIAIDNAVNALGTKATVLGLSLCHSTEVHDALGDYPKWAFLGNTPNPAMQDPDRQVQDQMDAALEWFSTLNIKGFQEVLALQAALTLQHHLNTAKEPTREGVAAVAKAWTGPVFLGSPTVAYGSLTNPFPMPALPSLATRAYEYQGNDSWVDLTDGAWLGLQ